MNTLPPTFEAKPIPAMKTTGFETSELEATVIRSMPRAERLRLFATELDALHAETLARMGQDDILYMTRLCRFSKAMEVLGRFAIHFSVDPLTFAIGVSALWIHKQLDWIEIGHTVLHGAYDRIEGGEAFASRTFQWDLPFDEEVWRHGHNVRHHGATNVAGQDPDMGLCDMRLTEHSPRAPHQKYQLPLLLGVIAPNFVVVLNSHLAGLNDLLLGHGGSSLEVVEPSRRAYLKRTLRKSGLYYLKEYVVFPALAGPLCGKVLLGNYLSELCRDVYSAITTICGHVGEDVKSWPVGTRAQGRGEWYQMQIEATNDFPVILPLSMLCGGIDRHIEHHIFPRLPPPRLREVAPRVRAICEKYGVNYRTDTWGNTLRRSLRRLGRLADEPMTRAARDAAGAS